MLQNDTLSMIFGLVYQKLQRSKHCILSERYGICAIIEKIVTVNVLFKAAIVPLNIILTEYNYM